MLRVGAGVEGLEPGDGVMGFGAQAFASHLTLPADRLFQLGQVLPEKAAAAVPVAFVTAWFALIERAGLKRGETVLIEGAAAARGLVLDRLFQHVGSLVQMATINMGLGLCKRIVGALRDYGRGRRRGAGARRRHSRLRRAGAGAGAAASLTFGGGTSRPSKLSGGRS